jgi:4-hydroxybutyryl-CoA dehydratase/vinylacetyl-CoA-Delta-isomerase
MKTAQEFIHSLERIERRLFVLGEKVERPLQHPILRLIESLILGAGAVSYRTESLHGAGSPKAQMIMINRLADLEGKKRLAKRLAGIE